MAVVAFEQQVDDRYIFRRQVKYHLIEVKCFEQVGVLKNMRHDLMVIVLLFNDSKDRVTFL